MNEMIFDLGQRHVVIQRRYEVLGAVNDLCIAILFLVGSFFFLSSELIEGGTWLFIVGSALLLIKPILKITSLVHVSRVFKSHQNL